MGYQIYQVAGRFGGYGVPTYCEYPSCKKVIDRGMAYACGGEPFSEIGCDRYFCGKHRQLTCWKRDGSDERCDHEGDCGCQCVEVCQRCAKGEGAFPYKPEHPKWMRHVLKDESWEEWRKKNPEKVEEFKKALEKKA